MSKFGIASGVALLAAFVAGSLPASAQTVDVTPTDLQGWTFSEVDAVGGSTGITGTQARSGNGSLELYTPNSSGRTRFGLESPYNPAAPTLAKLNEVTSLSFDWFRDYADRGRAFKAEVARLRERET